MPNNTPNFPSKTSALVFFSPTGTTRRNIHAVSDGIGFTQQSIYDLTLPQNRINPLPRIEEDLLILALPVYGDHIPSFLKSKLMELQGNGQPTVVLAVYGNVDFGLALLEMADILNHQGFNVAAGAALIGEHSFCNPSTPLAANRPNPNDLNTAQDFGRQIAKKLQSNPSSLIVLPGKLALAARILPDQSAILFSKVPELDPNLCNQCGLCARSCPMGAIDQTSLAIDTSKCIRCFACARICPKEARKIELNMRWISVPFLKAAASKKKEPALFL